MLLKTCSRSVPLAALLLGASVTFAATPSRAGGEHVSARDMVDGAQEGAADTRFAFGDPREERQDLDLDDWRSKRAKGGSEAARGLAAKRLLESLEDQINAGEWIPFRRSQSRGQQILATLEEALPDKQAANEDAEESFVERFRFNLVRGVEYRQQIPLGDQKLKLRLYGPIASGSLGLGFRLRGRVVAHDFEVKAYGSNDEGGVKLTVDF